MKIVALVLLLWCPFSVYAQLPEAPRAKGENYGKNGKYVVIANLAMYASSVLGAHATSFGSQQCFIEDVKVGDTGFGVKSSSGGRFHPWQRSFALSLPADGAITLASYVLYKKHHNLLAVVLPSASAGMQVGIAGVQYAQGCF